MLKENILPKSLTSKALDEDELILLRDTSVTDLADAADLPSPTAANLNQAYFVKGVHYRCEEVSAGVFEWITYDTSGQSLNYQDASNKPKINGITLSGTMTAEDLELAKDAASRTVISVPTAKEFLIGTSELITYENLAAALNTLFDIANLPKYEIYNNPLLTTGSGVCEWSVSHTCKTNTPIVQVFTSGGILVEDLVLLQHSGSRVSIQITSGVDIPANSYYAVLIG